MIHLYDGNNVMLRDLDKVGHERIGLRRRYELSNEGTHIWGWEGRNHNQRRKDVYPAYKAKREPMAEDRFAQIHVFREALRHSSCTQIECDGWEADDVIGALVRRFVSKGLQVTVHTNDFDYWQLMQYRGVTINGIRTESIPDCAPHHVPLFKALVGDKSDNIIGVPGFGIKSWMALTLPDRKLLQRAIDEYDLGAIVKLDLPKRPKNLLLDPANIELAQKAIAITRFIPVPDNELDKGISQGSLNRQAAHDLFRRFFL